MNLDKLIELIDANQHKKYIHLLNAMMDWPIEVETVEDYFNQVKEYLDIEEINTQLIVEKKKKIKLIIGSIWNLESISELLLFLKFNDDENKNTKQTL